MSHLLGRGLKASFSSLSFSSHNTVRGSTRSSLKRMRISSPAKSLTLAQAKYSSANAESNFDFDSLHYILGPSLKELNCTDTKSYNFIKMKRKKKNFYAVRAGRVTGIFTSWPECEKQVKGFKGARFKGFVTRDEAEAFIQGDDTRKKAAVGSTSGQLNGHSRSRLTVDKLKPKSSNIGHAKLLKGKQSISLTTAIRDEDREPGTILIYTDGACSGNRNSANCPAGWGYVALKSEKDGDLLKIHEDYGAVITSSQCVDYLGAEVKSNNTAELSAIGYSFKWLLKQEVKPRSVVIRYDSEYAAKAVKGEHKNSVKNLALISKIRSLKEKTESQGINIEFMHVKGHAGNFWNDEADRLARQGCAKSRALLNT